MRRPGWPHSSVMEVLLPLLVVLLAILAPLVGPDTRDGRDWQPRGDNDWRWR